MALDTSKIIFHDKPGKPAPNLFSEVAESAAMAVSDTLDKNKTNKASQLRRFYDEIVMWNEKVGDSPQKFDEFQPYIQMLKAKVAYAFGRKHVDENFRKLLDQIVEQSRSAETLRQGKLFFEAFMAYYKVYGKD
jgi:CRISPR-associated protein Csm2